HPIFRREISHAVDHVSILESPWLNHECATKQMAGYSFGTYLPPLYTPVSAEIAAENIAIVQSALDDRCRRPNGSTPLFLLEMPPLTYFAAGTLRISDYFRLVAERVACGFVLDMGHLWTVYRYTGAWRRVSLTRFLEEFLEEFPLERVVEIHVAGLALHAGIDVADCSGSELPLWLDAHAAPIPSVLFDMLEQVLSHNRLTSLKGVALEVDTKAIDLIVAEFEQAWKRFGSQIQDALARGVSRSHVYDVPQHVAPSIIGPLEREHLSRSYVHYANIVSGLTAPSGGEWAHLAHDPQGLAQYRDVYLPVEILEWGGSLIEMFPETCRALHQHGIALDRFVSYWFHTPRPMSQPYDFFLLKIDRFVDFVQETLPETLHVTRHEADGLRTAYAEANEPVISIGNHA
ncbi:MAG TPA: DUF692 family multinuclear iron-containing protein, partial [Nitrospiraceae bacterium]